MKRRVVAVGLLTLGVAACHRSCSYSGSTSLSFGPDAAALGFTSPVDAAAEASSAAVSLAGDAGAVPSRFAGVFHLPRPVEEANLTLDPGGTFRWSHFGCSERHASCGQWATKGTLVVLTPLADARTMDWIDDASFTAQVTRVDVAEHGGRLEMRAYLPDGKSFAQVWSQGQVCLTCSSKTGPATLAPCNTPFPTTCP